MIKQYFNKFKSLKWYFQISIIISFIGILTIPLNPVIAVAIIFFPLMAAFALFFSIPGLIFWLIRYLIIRADK